MGASMAGNGWCCFLTEITFDVRQLGGAIIGRKPMPGPSVRKAHNTKQREKRNQKYSANNNQERKTT
jgi:hypothetical protein